MYICVDLDIKNEKIILRLKSLSILTGTGDIFLKVLHLRKDLKVVHNIQNLIIFFTKTSFDIFSCNCFVISGCMLLKLISI